MTDRPIIVAEDEQGRTVLDINLFRATLHSKKLLHEEPALTLDKLEQGVYTFGDLNNTGVNYV